MLKNKFKYSVSNQIVNTINSILTLHRWLTFKTSSHNLCLSLDLYVV